MTLRSASVPIQQLNL